jgi:tetratricopeptide (TPR) repeat protein
MFRSKRAVCGVLLGVALGWPVTGQEVRPPKRAEPGTKTLTGAGTAGDTTPAVQSALHALDQLSAAIKTLDDEHLRVRTQAHVADILWPYDEPRARRQFDEVFQSIAQAQADKQNTSPLAQLQSEVLSLVARHDAELADSLIRDGGQVKPQADSGASPPAEKLQSDNSALYLQVATSLAGTNPERAVRLAESGLARGVNPSILGVLFALRQSDPARANALYRSTLAVARRDAPRASLNIPVLASYVLPGYTTTSAFGDPVPVPPTGAAVQPDRALIAEFLNFVYDTFVYLSDPAQAHASNPVDYMTGRRLLPYFAQHMPERAPLFRNLLAIIADRSGQAGAIDIVDKMFQPAEGGELSKQAEAARDPFQKDLLYLRAILAAAASGDFEQALSLVGKINNGDFRSGLDSVVRYQAATSLLGKGDVEGAVLYAKSVSEVRQRASLFAKIARELLNKKDVARASAVLTDAREATRKADAGAEKAQALLILAEAEIRLDPARGFEVMEAAIKEFNDADSGSGQKAKVAPGGFNLSAMLTQAFKLETPDFGPSFSLLARADFNRAMQLAQMLKKKERAVLAQLAACRSVLAGKPKRKA